MSSAWHLNRWFSSSCWPLHLHHRHPILVSLKNYTPPAGYEIKKVSGKDDIRKQTETHHDFTGKNTTALLGIDFAQTPACSSNVVVSSADTAIVDSSGNVIDKAVLAYHGGAYNVAPLWINESAFDGGAQWIWRYNKVQEPRENKTYIFQTKFKLDSGTNVKKAILKSAADNILKKIVLNGHVLRNSHQTPIHPGNIQDMRDTHQMDVANYLKTDGSVNVLRFTVINGRMFNKKSKPDWAVNPAGLIFSLHVIPQTYGNCVVTKVAQTPINQPPTAIIFSEAGSPRFKLNGIGSRTNPPGGSLDYSWSATKDSGYGLCSIVQNPNGNGPAYAEATAKATRADTSVSCSFSLTVTDNNNATDTTSIPRTNTCDWEPPGSATGHCLY